MRILSKLKPITPTELFKKQVEGVMNFARNEGTNVVTIPPQFGGLFGQRSTLQEDLVINVISVDGR